jgi:hypothetical protein
MEEVRLFGGRAPFQIAGSRRLASQVEGLLSRVCTILEEQYEARTEAAEQRAVAHKLALLYEARGPALASVVQMWTTRAQLHSLEEKAKANLFELAQLHRGDAGVQLKVWEGLPRRSLLLI